MRRPAVAATAIGIALLALGVSCREPTQITLVLTTDVDCATVQRAQTEILVGTRASVADGTALSTSASSCRDTAIGSLAIVPGGDDTVAITVHQATKPGKASSTCRADATDCITARRVISFVPHTPLTLPVDLSLSCLNVPCGSTETCVSGKCVSDTVNPSLCKSGVCGPDTLVPPDAGSPDAGVPDAADAAPPDAGCNANLLTDKKNCGACGFDCSGGECTGGVCRLVPTNVLAENGGDKGCLALQSNGTKEELFWTRTGAQPGVYRVLTQGGPATQYFSPGSGVVGSGIAASAAYVAFNFESTGSTTLLFCDPSLSFNLCSKRTVQFPASAWVAMDREVAPAAYMVTGGSLLSTTIAHDKTGGYAGPIAATKGYLAATTTSGSPALQVIDLATDIVSSLLATPIAIVGDAGAARFFVASGNKIERIDVAPFARTDLYTNVSAVGAMAYRSSQSPQLFWTRLEGGADTFYRGPPDGPTPSATKIHTQTSAGAITCLAAGKDAVYWIRGGVPFKRFAK